MGWISFDWTSIWSNWYMINVHCLSICVSIHPQVLVQLRQLLIVSIKKEVSLVQQLLVLLEVKVMPSLWKDIQINNQNIYNYNMCTLINICVIQITLLTMIDNICTIITTNSLNTQWLNRTVKLQTTHSCIKQIVRINLVWWGGMWSAPLYCMQHLSKQ